jgi:preprotein translocase subunit SecE
MTKQYMNILNFFKEVKGEMKHVNWPTRKQTTTYALLVVVVSLFVAAYVGVFDHLFTLGIQQLTK